MSRSRMIGAISALALAAGLVSGCGATSDGGSVAAQATPAPATATPATGAPATSTTTTTTTTAANPATTKALGAYPAADPKAPSIGGYEEFSKARAGQIFIEPASLQAAKAAATSAAAASTTAATSSGTTGAVVPATGATATGDTTTTGGTTTPASGSTTPSSGSTTPALAVAGSKPASATASLKVDGAPLFAKPGVQVPSVDPVFTVKSVLADKIVLELITGSFPGGSKTVDIAAGASVTLSNPSTKKTIVIEVVSITPAA